MWVRSKELKQPIKDTHGRLWHFQLWWDSVDGKMIQRVFFWDEAKKNTGVFELVGDSTLHYSKLRQRIGKLAKNSAYRQKYLRELKFPLERYYCE